MDCGKFTNIGNCLSGVDSFINYVLYIYCSHIADKTFEDADTYNLVDTASLETVAL